MTLVYWGRWLKVGALAAWLAAHIWFWSALPTLPRWMVPEVRDFDFARDGRTLVTTTKERIQVWDTASGRLVREQPWPKGLGDDQSILVAPDGRQLLVHDSHFDRACLLDLASGRVTGLRPMPPDPSFFGRTLNLFPGTAAFTPDGREVVQLTPLSKSGPYALVITEIDGLRERIIELQGKPHVLTVSPDGRTAAVHPKIPVDGDKENVQVIDLVTGQKLWSVLTADTFSVGIEFSPDGQTVALVCRSMVDSEATTYDVSVRDRATGQLRATVDSVRAWCGWAEDGSFTICRAEQLWRLDGRTGEERRGEPPVQIEPELTYVGVGAARFLPLIGERPLPFLFSALPGKLVDWLPDDLLDVLLTSESQVFDLGGWRWVGPIRTKPDAIYGFAPDGRTIYSVSNSADQAITLWDIHPRRPGGIVLALMIAQVSLLIAWTVWRAKKRPRKVDIHVLMKT